MPGKARPAPKTARTHRHGRLVSRSRRCATGSSTSRSRRGPATPSSIRGNLANGAAALDLKLAGTGLAPYLEGSVRIEEFKASLPFSTLTVSRGFVYFNKDAPFQPSLEIQADSQTRDYLVHAYIYGAADRSADPAQQRTAAAATPTSSRSSPPA